MLLEIDNIVKDYRGGVRANDGISLSIDRGEVFGLLGPNGAGKTTLVSQIVALVSPTSGTIEIGGVDIAANPAHASVDGQRKCPAKWPAKMSLVLLAMITDGSYSTRSRFMGGLRASMYFFAVSR